MASCAPNLDQLCPAEVRTATQIGIDTGRRPEDILDLPVDCLDRDTDGAAVLVYDNAKADRLGRRLPITQATAAVITAQQHGSGQRFPDTPIGELKLLPSHGATPTATRAITHRHARQAAPRMGDALPALRTATAPSSTRPGSFPTPIGTPTPNATPTPGCRSTCSPNYLITEI